MPSMMIASSLKTVRKSSTFWVLKASTCLPIRDWISLGGLSGMVILPEAYDIGGRSR